MAKRRRTFHKHRSRKSFRNTRAISIPFERLEERLMLAAESLNQEFLVNDLIIRNQSTWENAPTVAVSDVNRVVAFAGKGPQDDAGVFAKLYDASSDVLLSTFQVNSTRNEAQYSPVVASTPTGEFVVAWAGRGVGDQSGIFFQLYDATGRRLGTETLANTTTGGTQDEPSLAMAADGRFTIVWHGVGTGDFSGVFERRFAADGTPTSREVLVNQTVTDDQSYPSVAIDLTGNTVVTWSSRHQDGSDWGIEARRFDAQGAAVGNEFAVNATTTASQLHSQAAYLPSGEFLVSWSSWAQDGDSWGSYVRRFSATGTALGDELRLNSDTAGNQLHAAIAAGSSGDLLATYTSGVPDGSGWETYALALNLDGSADGTPIQVNQLASGYASGSQLYAVAALSTTGEASVVYSGNGSLDHSGVYLAAVSTGVSVDLAAINDQTIDELTTLSLTATATTSSGAAVMYAFERSPVGATIDATTGAIAWTPTEAQGPGVYAFTVIAQLSATRRDKEVFIVTVREVNQAPMLATIGSKSVIEEQELTFTASATDADLPSQRLVYRLGTNAPLGATIDPLTGVFRWTPTEAQGPGSYPVTVIVTDLATPEGTDEETVTIAVAEANRPPVLSEIADLSLPVGGTLVVALTATDPDLPANTLTFRGDVLPTGATLDTATGVIRWVPAATQGDLSHTFTVTVLDNGTPQLSDTITFHVAVTSTNDPPVLDPIADATIDELAPFTISAKATDPNQDTLTFTFDGDSHGATMDAATGVIHWTPTEAQGPGQYAFVVVVTDDGSPNLQDTTAFVLTVREVNRPPVLAPIEDQTIDELTPLAVTAAATDPDTPANLLTYTLVDGMFPSGATIDSLSGVISWTPTEAQGPGVYPFRVRVSDNVNPSLTAVEDFSVTVREVNLAPVLSDVAAQQVDQGQELTVVYTATDADEPLNNLTFEIVGDARGATITAGSTPRSAVFDWTPSEEFAPGLYEFAIRVRDQGSPEKNDTTTLSVTVNQVANVAPSFNKGADQTISENSGSHVVAPWAINISAGSPSEVGQQLTFLVHTDHPEYFEVAPAIAATGELSFTSKIDAVGTAQVTVTLQDDGGTAHGGIDTSPTQTFAIQINPCPFDADLTDWRVTQDGGTPVAKGTVTAVDCQAVLREGDSFRVAIEQTFTVPAGATSLSFHYDALNFDTTSTNLIKDAFEVALVDSAGASLVPTYTGDASRDAFLNITEGLSPAQGQGVTVVNGLVTVGLMGVAPGTLATLIFRLANNDADTSTSVRIVDVTLPAGTLLAPQNSTAKFFVADPAIDGIFRYAAAGTPSGSFVTSPSAPNVRGIASTSAGTTLWTIDTAHRVNVYAPDGTALGGWIADGVASPEGITVFNNTVWIVDRAFDRVFSYEGAATRHTGTILPTSSFALDAANTSASDLVTNGTLVWVTDDAADRVFVYTTAGVLQGSWTLDAANADVSGITLDPTGAGTDLWTVDRVAAKVYRYTNAQTLLSGSQSASDSFVLATANAHPEAIADPAPDSIPIAVKWRRGNFGSDASNAFTALPSFNQVMMTPVVIDLDGDHVPEVVFSTYDRGNLSGNSAPAVLRAVRGDTGADVWTNTDVRVEGYAGLAAGDIDSDGRPEIIAHDRSGHLVAFNADGSLKWSSAAIPGNLGWGSAAIANIDGIGEPEIVIGATVLNSDGSIRWSGSAGSGDNGVGPLSLVADIDLDGHPEIVTGNTIYRSDGSIYRQFNCPDGFAALGNFDNDSNPEIVLVSNGIVYLFQYDNPTPSWQIAIPGGGAGGAPTIADIDGDGSPDITVAGANHYVAIDALGHIKWSTATQDGSSNVTGSSVFDLDGDGSAEVLYGDELGFYIYRGSDGHELARVERGSGTTYEMPIVADIDGNGSAEVVLIANDYGIGNSTGIITLTSPGAPWSNTRSIWNQHTYHITNVNDDGTIPAVELSSWELYNNYRRNQQTTGTQIFPPTISASAPVATATIGTSVVLSGKAAANGTLANGSTNRIVTIEVNGRAVDILDAEGNFFANVVIEAGEDKFHFIATDAAGQTVSTDVTVIGSATSPTAIDFSRYADITDSFRGVYGRTSFQDDSNTLFVELATTNTGTFATDVPLLVGVKNLRERNTQQPTVEVLGADGVTPDGIPYFNFSQFVKGAAKRLGPGETTDSPVIAFSNPNRVRFDYDLVFYGKLNAPPVITSVPKVEALIGKPYSYPVTATDADGDSLSYRLVEGPAGMTMPDSAAGILAWTPTAADQGNHTVVVEANDGRGGVATQRYTLSVIPAPPNRPPVITSTPVTMAMVGDVFGEHETVVNLSSWQPYTFAGTDGGNPIALWNVDASGTFVEQRNNADASIFLSDFQVDQQTIRGSFRVNDTGLAGFVDNDFIGFVFAYQGTGQFYLFDWKGGSQNDGLAGMSIKIVDVVAPYSADDFWPTIGNSNRIRTLYHDTRNIGWNDFSDYRFQLDFRSGSFVIKVWEIGSGGAETLLNEISIADSTYSSGRFGFYNYSQGQVQYRGFTRTAQTSQTYRYDVEALDPDGDTLTYTLATKPDGMFINPSTGLISWGPTADQVGNHSVKVQVADGRGGVATQEFTICVKPDPANHAPIFTSDPIPTATIGSTYQYQAAALDPDNDSLAFEKLAGPSGLIINSTTGLVTWNTAGQVAGPQDVTIRVRDPKGSFSDQPFTIDVKAPGTGEIRGTKIKDLDGDGILPKDTIVYQQDFETTSDTLSEWSLPHIAVTPIGNRRYLGDFGAPGTTIDNAEQETLSLAGLPTHSKLHIQFDLFVLGSWDGNAPNGPDIWRAAVRGGATLVNATFSNTPPEAPNRQSYPSDTLDINNPSRSGAIENNALGYLWQGNILDSVYHFDLEIDHTAANIQLDFGAILTSGFEEAWGIDNVIVSIPNGEIGNPLPNWTIYLDANNNNRRDIGEPSTLTDAIGNYAFTGLAAATYTVREVPQTGWHQTYPTSASGSQIVVLATSQIATGIDFGNTQIAAGPNSNPSFASTPVATATFGNLYRYDAVATDPENDLLTYALIAGPAGMTLNPQTGTLVWQPQESQLGEHTVVLRVTDGHAGVAVQQFTLTVVAPNTAPVISSQPATQAVVGKPFVYDIAVQDADGDLITVTLVSGSVGALAATPTMGPNNSPLQTRYRLEWTPSAAELAAGKGTLKLRAEDGRGGSTEQIVEVSVVAAATNEPPQIHSEPRTVARPGVLYGYAVLATDANADPLTFSLDVAKQPAGMTISPTGVITWTPPLTASGTYPVRVLVSDGAATVDQAFDIKIASQADNVAPEITSNPRQSGRVSKSYVYDAVAADGDGDPVTWSLEAAPIGMSINAATGAIRWTPRADQVGTHQVVLRATDPLGASTQQSFTIEVGCANLPPLILSTPPTQASVGATYYYGVRAVEPEGDALTFTLVQRPPDNTMTISPTGLIRWTPPAADAGQTRSVAVRVADPDGGFAIQEFKIEVTVATNLNRAPVITSIPVFAVTVGDNYSYQVTATDADGDPLTYSLPVKPAWLSIDANGLITGTPPSGAVEPVVVEVSDGTSKTTQGFAINARVNQAPTIESLPALTTKVGATYRYSVMAKDPDGDALSYSLVSGPEGMTIDGFGRMIWKVPVNFDTTKTAAVSIKVADSRGVSAPLQTFSITVTRDDTKPTVLIDVQAGNKLLTTAESLDLGATATVRVTAFDDVGVASRSLAIDGALVPLDEHGQYTLNANQLGAITLVAKATDLAGNEGESTRTVLVINPAARGGNTPAIGDPTLPPYPGPAPGDNQAPTVTITDPKINASISGPTAVIGTVDDPEGHLWYYRTEYARVDLVDIGSIDLADPDWHLIQQGTQEVANKSLGTFDPSLLGQDAYIIIVAAFDANGQGNVASVIVSVEGNLVLGNFHLEFTDLTIPLAGIPITVSRVYDTRDAGREGDFGYGWSLGVQDARILETIPAGEAFVPGKTKVYLTSPDGKREGFTYMAKPKVGTLFGAIYTPYFQADPGVYDTLSINETEVSVGGLFEALDGPFNPDTYILTTSGGTKYTYNQSLGLQTIVDRNGNTVTFSDTGIKHSSGVGVTFRRDNRSRITEITSPDGQKLRYAYNAAGDLVSFTSQGALTTTFAYRIKPAHYLDEILDPLGRRAVKTEYDNQGRILYTIDAAGNVVEYDHSLDGFERVKDAAGNSTLLKYDTYGNVTEERRGEHTITLPGGAQQTAYDSIVLTQYIHERDGVTSPNRNKEWKVTQVFLDALGATVKETTTEYDYDTRGNVTKVIDVVGGQTLVRESAYDSKNNVTRVKDELGRQTLFTYDAAGNLREVVNAEGKKASTVFDSLGRVTSYTDFAGNTTMFVYQGSNPQPSEIRNPGHTDVVPNVRKFEYNALGQTIKITDEEGIVTVYEYDTQGRETYQRVGQDAPVRSSYQGQNLYRRIVARSEVEVGATDLVTEYGYTATDLVRFEIDPLGAVTGYEYDANGNRTFLGRWNTKADYDADQAAKAASSSTVFAGRYPKATFEHVFVYDRLGRVDYELDDVQLALAEQAGLPLDQITVQLDYDYDSAGNRTEIIDRNGRKRTFIYDERNRKIGELWWQLDVGSGQEVVIRSFTWQYCTCGNISIATEYDGPASSSPILSQYAYKYDLLGRLVSVDNAGTKDMPHVVLSYGYDANGNQTRVEDNLGVAVVSTYDAQNRLKTRAWDNKAGVDPAAAVDEVMVEFDYYKNGTQKELRRFDLDDATGAKTLVGRTRYGALDASGRVQTISHRDALDQAIAEYAYGFDKLGLVKSLAYNNRNDQYDFEVAYGYDDLGQLTGADYSAATTARGIYVDESYNYDRNGNRVSSHLHGGGYITGPGNRLLSDGTFNYVYDNDGNQIRKTEIATGEVTVFEYDYRNLMTRATRYSQAPESGGIILAESTNRYDVDGRRIVFTSDEDGTGIVPPQLTQVTHNGNDTWADFGDVGMLRGRYLHGHGIDVLLGTWNSAEVKWLLCDMIGTVRDFVGEQIDHSAFSSFGSLLTVTPDISSQRFLFTGREYDAAADLHYFRARHLDSQTGVFKQADPIGFNSGDMNLFRYTFNNPISASDPFGTTAIISYASLLQISFAVVGVVGAGATIAGVYANYVSSSLPGFNDGPRDAVRHCAWLALMTEMFGATIARQIGVTKEDIGDINFPGVKDNKHPESRGMDEHNNAIGIALGLARKSPYGETCISLLPAEYRPAGSSLPPAGYGILEVLSRDLWS